MAGRNGSDDDATLARMRRIIETPPPLVEAVGSLYEHAIRRVLSGSYRVTSAAEGKRLLAAEDTTEAMADHVQRVVVIAVPIVRTLARGARFTRVPWVLVATTAFSVASTLKAGVREVQTVGSLLAHRIETETGSPADPDVVHRLALDLYLSPRKSPPVEPHSLPLWRLVQRWIFKGAFGRDTRKAAEKALDSAERLDLSDYLLRRLAPGSPARDDRIRSPGGARSRTRHGRQPGYRRGSRPGCGRRGLERLPHLPHGRGGRGLCGRGARGGRRLGSGSASGHRLRGRRARAFAAADEMGPLTALVANAGIVGGRHGSTSSRSDRIERTFAVNAVGTILCCREAVRRQSTRHGGSGGAIVLVSSAASRLGSPHDYVDYAASKGAVDTLGLGLAREVAAEGIRVNVVRPGIIETDIHASRRPARPRRADDPGHPRAPPGPAEEVAAAIVWLLGDDASYCTGSILDV